MFGKKKVPKAPAVLLKDAVVQEVVKESAIKGGGDKFTKIARGSVKNYSVLFDETGTFIKAGTKKTVDITTIREVRVGYLTQEFLTHGELKKIPEECALSIIYDSDKSVHPKILNLVADSVAQRDWWNASLQKLLEYVHDATGEAYSVMKPWLLTCEGKETISWKMAMDVLESLGMKCSWAAAKKIVKEFDTDGDKKLDFHEFLHAMRKLRSHDVLNELFEKYAEKNSSMSAAQLQKFFAEEQTQTISSEVAEKWIAKYSVNDQKTLCLDSFQLLMISKENELWNPEKVERHQDMTRPLSDYYIDSSHNTYLVGDQLKSASSIEMYVRALRLGCRCVELDMWDGPDDEPIVHHGYTLTSKILLCDILKLLKTSGFQRTPYPIILSLENHCSKKVQDKVAAHIEEILGDMVVRLPEGGMKELPSPEDLKYKILIKAKATASDKLEMDEEIEEDGLQGEDAREKEPQTEHKVEKISESLKKLVFLCATHFDDFETCASWAPYQMSSFSEPKTFKILGKGEAGYSDFQGYNKNKLSRIYPKGTRFDSSNYDPQLPWKAGCQIVALNYQSSETFPLWINYAKFRENGHSGYNLRETAAELAAPQDPVKIKIKVVGGRLLPQRSKIDLLDSYVRVKFRDSSDNFDSFVSDVVSDNALNPNYNLECKTECKDPKHTFVEFSVFDQNAGVDAFVCQWTAPLSCLRTGLRVAHLLDGNFMTMSRGMAHLLLQVEIEK